MINFYSENNFVCRSKEELLRWVGETIHLEGYEEGEVDFIFCNDDYLYELNVEFLKHDTFTDIISFDYGVGMQINGEIYISTERVKENAGLFDTEFETELHRVIIHGILHFCGYRDKTDEEKVLMRKKEEEALNRRSFV